MPDNRTIEFVVDRIAVAKEKVRAGKNPACASHDGLAEAMCVAVDGGKMGNNAQGFIGYIDAVQIFSNALSATQITNLYLSSTNGHGEGD